MQGYLSPGTVSIIGWDFPGVCLIAEELQACGYLDIAVENVGGELSRYVLCYSEPLNPSVTLWCCWPADAIAAARLPQPSCLVVA